MTDKSVSIILPFYNNWYLTHSCMMSLYSHIAIPVEIILVDDCSTDDNIAGAMGWWRNNGKHRVICIKNPKNMGFGESMNRGVHRSTGKIVILLSNDVKVSGDFVSLIQREIKKNEKILIGGEIHDWDTSWNFLEICGKRKLFPYAAGWLLACLRDTWHDLGGFDSRYERFDYEDMDLSTTAIHKGYKIVGLNSDMLRHFGGQTVRKYHPDREKQTMINRQKFIDKWSKILSEDEENSG